MSRPSAIRSGRLDSVRLRQNFCDLHPPLSVHEARVAADRCYFCHDAPCTAACPTTIDIPLFIRKIAGGNVEGAARTIFASNILGGICARVCPTETLCEEACVRNGAETHPVEIGRLQRFATDRFMAGHRSFGERAGATGKAVAVVGAGPAGLAAAHALALAGHTVTVFEAADKAGGLNEYGIAAYKAVDDFAAREVAFVLAIGGITVRTGQRLGRDITLAELIADHDAVFLGLGLGAVNALGTEGETSEGVADAVDFIAALRQAEDLATVAVGDRVVVIGGGMTAIDAAVQARKLGADEVDLVYRRGAGQMPASRLEQELATSHGVVVRHYAAPLAITSEEGAVSGVTFGRTAIDADGQLKLTGARFFLPADQVLKAIGQRFVPGGVEKDLALEGGRIKVDGEGRTSLPKVWAGGDCVFGGEDLTVAAVRDGRNAAASINAFLAG